MLITSRFCRYVVFSSYLAGLEVSVHVCSISKVCPYFTYATICAAITSFYFRQQDECEWTWVVHVVIVFICTFMYWCNSKVGGVSTCYELHVFIQYFQTTVTHNEITHNERIGYVCVQTMHRLFLMIQKSTKI